MQTNALAIAAVVALAVPITQAQVAPQTPPAPTVKEAIYQASNALGMLRSNQEVDLLSTVEFWGTGTAARVVGTDTVDGLPAKVIAFVRPDIPAWFRLWVGDADGLVHKLEMRAEGHIMEQAYADLNGPIAVIVPQP